MKYFNWTNGYVWRDVVKFEENSSDTCAPLPGTDVPALLSSVFDEMRTKKLDRIVVKNALGYTVTFQRDKRG